MRNLLENLYWEQELSIAEIAKKLDIGNTTVHRRMKKHGVQTRTPSEAYKLAYKKFDYLGFQKGNNCGYLRRNRKVSKEARRKISKTLKKRYKDPKFKKTHGFQEGHEVSQEVRKKLSKKLKGNIPWSKGKTNIHSKEGLKRIKEARRKQNIPTHHTKPEKQFIRFVKKHDLPLQYVGDSSYWIGNHNPDFIDTKNRVIVEIFGDYWHNPDRYPDLRYDQTEEGRKEVFAKSNYKCIVIWDYELDNKDAVFSKLGDYFG